LAAGLTSARAVVSRLSGTKPAVVTLAELLSIAVRVEPELLRAMRLRFLPNAGAEIESEWYFSPLVAERSDDWCLFDPDVQAELRRRVSVRAKAKMLERIQMADARKLIESAHTDAPAGIIVEERILWQETVQFAGDKKKIRRAVEGEMDQVLAHVLDKTLEGDSLARWFANAADRLPLVARQTEAYRSLAFAVSNFFGVYSPAPAHFPGPLLSPSTERVSLWAGLRRSGLSFEPRPVEGYVEIAVPRTKPILLDVRTAVGPSRLLSLALGDSALISAEGEVEVRTLAGDSYRFISEAETASEARDLESARQSGTAKGHADSVLSVQVGPNGRLAVSGSSDSTLKVWDLESGRELRTLVGHALSLNTVAMSPDGRIAVSASSDRTLKVWDLDSGLLIRSLEGHSLSVNGVAVCPDGRRAISASSDKTLMVWDLETGRALRTMSGHTLSVNAVAVCPDGRRAISASSDQSLKVWDLNSGSPLVP
jgi:hypothetical protein